MMRAAIISVGDELLGGRCLDTNSYWLAGQLARPGIELVETRSIGDDHERLVAAVEELAPGIDLLLLTGGLGPTPDDLTREVLASVLAEELVTDPTALKIITDFFLRDQLPMAKSQQRLAQRPPSAESFPNHVGTAPTLHSVIDRSGPVEIWLLPGPPHELKDAWQRYVDPWLQSRVVVETGPPAVDVLAFGLLEADFVARLGELADRSHRPLVGTRVSRGHLLLHVDPLGGSPESLAKSLDTIATALSPYVLAPGETSLAMAVGSLLTARAETVATAESCTAGLISSQFVDVPGASAWFPGGWVAYANDMKSSALGVSPELIDQFGAVSAEVACALAVGAARRAESSWALASTGIAGPTGGSADKPVGTVWIGLSGPEGTRARCFRFGTGRARVRERTATMALQMLRWALRGDPADTVTAWDAP